MRNVAAGNKRRGNRNSRFNKKEKRNGNVGDDESIEDLEKRQRLQEQEVAAANLGTTAGARPQASFLDFPLAPRSELQIPLNLPINSVQRHSSSHSEADQLLEWLTNTAAVGGAAAAGFAGNGGESNIGGLDDVSALKSPTYSGLGNPTFMHGLGNLSTTEHHALHRCNNIAVFPNPLRPLAFVGERSKSAASSRSAAEILGATATAAANLMNVHVQHLEGNKNTPSTALNRDSFAVSEGAGFFSPPPVTRKVATTDEDQQLGLNNRKALKTRQIAPHAFFSPDSATSPAS
ncbi:hypothetical protein Ndes2526A_g08594 [Nannochloris sp. 'desiccata']